MQHFIQPAMTPAIVEKISRSGVIAVLVIDKASHAVPVARALLQGGVHMIELTLRTAAALEAAHLIKKEVPEITLGFGTVITVDQVKAVVDAGADFAVAPGCNPKIITAARTWGLPFAPGIMTPSEIEIAVDHGCSVMKFFPAETAGGLVHLNSMVNPYQYLGLQFIPLGGCNMNNAQAYLESNLIAAIGGSWIATQKIIQSEQWDTIAANASAISLLVKKVRTNKA